MDDGLLDIVIQTVADVATVQVVPNRSTSKHDPVAYELQRQLDEARNVNRSLCAFLKDEVGLTDQQIAKARKYKPIAHAKETLTQCPHCKQQLFSRNVRTCSHCGGNLLPTGSNEI